MVELCEAVTRVCQGCPRDTGANTWSSKEWKKNWSPLWARKQTDWWIPRSEVVLHIDATDITEIDICPPILISILWYPSHWHISISYFSCCAQSILQKNTAHTLWLSRMITSIFNIILSILNSMLIFTCSPHFSKLLGVMPFVLWIFA